MKNRKAELLYFNRYSLKHKYWMMLWFEIGREVERNRENMREAVTGS
jgi:hypothetical protein